jgi:hypothetical protein
MLGDKQKSTREMQESHRARIKTSKLIDRLQLNADGELVDTVSKAKIEMTAGQIKSAEILLRKTLPDLKMVEITGDELSSLIIKRLMIDGTGNTATDPTSIPAATPESPL